MCVLCGILTQFAWLEFLISAELQQCTLFHWNNRVGRLQSLVAFTALDFVVCRASLTPTDMFSWNWTSLNELWRDTRANDHLFGAYSHNVYRLVLCESFVKLLKRLAILIDHLSRRKHQRPELALINDLDVTCFGFIVAKNQAFHHKTWKSYLTRITVSRHASNSTTVLDLKLIEFLTHP